ncbi:GNAT family N-acetyltransferase [Ochrobactrum sp. RH2CCR150]|uniref:GNAT family N-acetyltransferase n=1 Tax=Ochrobactrum sp. RH2CCR150 TaxID=2587044 RepID=UPI0015F7D4B8|nr:ribosomal protein S18 acetylase RimI-like enzyme [Ochrobactrum sp. RH2CCR150]
MTTLRIVAINQDFARWDELLNLIRDSFAYMDGVIDPPSSAHLLTAEGLKQKAGEEIGFAALIGVELVGCVFIKERSDSFYLGKLAVASAFEGQGIARVLMQRAEAETIAKGKPAIELQVRIELTRNRAVFEKLGYCKIGETAHPGYTRTTSITMRKEIVLG